MDFTLDLLSWRTYLAQSSRLPKADIVLGMARRHVVQAGEETIALVEAVAEIVEGFSIQWKHARACTKGVKPTQYHGAASAPLSSTMELMQDELRGFARRFGRQIAGKRWFSLKSPPHLPQIKTADRSSRSSMRGVTADIHALHALLASEDSRESEDSENGAAILTRLESWCAGLGDPETRMLAALPLADQICALAALNLRAFLYETADLSTAPLGSATMLQAAAQFNSFALGPYFKNVGALARHSGDIFELAHVAADAAAGMGSEAEAEMEQAFPTTCWAALLARSLQGPLLWEVVDDLGDLDARAALAIVFDHTVSNKNATDLGLVARLRDIALDNLDYENAARAQRHMCDARPGNVLELEILGSIHFGLGNLAAARQVLEEALKQEPGNGSIEERLSALREHRFEPFLLTQGIGSPEDRQHTRLGRRSRHSPAPRVPVANVTSVEFTF